MIQDKMINSYQTFSDQAGSSKSQLKLEKLRLPSLEGLSLLDIGCNEGFFVFEAAKLGASRVIGIDVSKDFIERGNARLALMPEELRDKISLINSNWDSLPGRFDVILFLSAVHYVEDQEAFIKNLIENHLTDAGVLILETGIIFHNENNEYIEVKRSIDSRFFPTIGKIKSALEKSAYKIIGRSVDQDGDPVERWVIHIRKRRQILMVVGAPANSGKSTLNRMLHSESVGTVSTDDIIYQIFHKTITSVDNKFQAYIIETYNGTNLDLIYQEIDQTDFFHSFLEDIYKNLRNYDNGIISIEGQIFIKDRFRAGMLFEADKRGYYPWYVTRY